MDCAAGGGYAGMAYGADTPSLGFSRDGFN